MKLKIEEKINLKEILKDLESYRPRRKNWVWREKSEDGTNMSEFHFKNTTKPLKNSIPLPAAKYFDFIDPQPESVITTEIASGRFEDDIRRMRMAAWHGADHLMVIRTMGQSHMDGLIEGTPQGIGGVPISRKQIRATKKAIDMIEDEVGRPINFHSYVSGVAGPEIAVLFAEEGVNGAHQDPQYNVLYRNINMYRSFTDAASAKKIMADAGIFQIDGAHNANATARKAWKVMPELMVQHSINCMFSAKAGIKKENIGLSTVPPNSPPAPKFWFDFPYAIALRDFFREYKMRAQMNTRYIESDVLEATRTHVIDTLISVLTRADIQSTITPDEGRNVPWHVNNIRGLQTAKQSMIALDGIKELLEPKMDGPLGEMVRELKERAVLFMEEILEIGGYFSAVEKGYFVDSGSFPERNGDGIARDPKAGIAADTIVKRDDDYFAPVESVFGYNNLPDEADPDKPCNLIGGCTLCTPDKIQYIDELDENDNVNLRLQQTYEDEEKGVVKPEVEWHGDQIVVVEIIVPAHIKYAPGAALKMAEKMGLEEPTIINKQILHPAEGTYFEVKGKLNVEIKLDEIEVQEEKELLKREEIEKYVKDNKLKAVAATVGSDEHSVGMREIIDIKHGGLEKFGVEVHYLGTSVPIEKLVDAAIETGAKLILQSTIISHDNIHYKNMKKLHNLCIEKGIRDDVVLVCGGTQVDPAEAKKTGIDAGFGRGANGHMVADFVVRKLTDNLQ